MVQIADLMDTKKEIEDVTREERQLHEEEAWLKIDKLVDTNK